MRNIAIFVSGEGNSTERIVSLFNEGNRVKTVLVVASDSGRDILERLSDKDLTILHIPDADWEKKIVEITELVKKNKVSLLVFDNFDLDVPEILKDTTDNKIVNVTTPDQAPREVVAELESDLRRPKATEIIKEENKRPKNAEEEWAESLKINFIPPSVPTSPPPVPGEPGDKEREMDEIPSPQEVESPVQKKQHSEPMPSTYLIWSILITVFCCFIPGIIAIIYSSQVSSKYYCGDFEGARKASRMAEIWIIVSVVLGVMSATLYVPFMLIGS